MFTTWWRGGSRRRATGGRRAGVRSRLGVEGLEDRRVPDAGALDPTFGVGGRVVADFGREVYPGGGVVVQPDGRIVVAATIQSSPFAGVIVGAGNLDVLVARYNADGTPDDTFGTGGRVVTDFGGQESALGLALQADGRIVVVGSSGPRQDFLPGSNFLVARFNADGGLDDTFGTGGRVVTDFGTRPGPFDSSYDAATAVAVQADGGIVVVGSTQAGGGILGGGFFLGLGSSVALARYGADGTPDDTFGTGGRVTVDRWYFGETNGAAGVALQADGRIVVVGTSSYAYLTPLVVTIDPETGERVITHSPTVSALFVARFEADGRPDAGFGQGGAVVETFTITGAAGSGLALQPDGAIVVAGSAGGDFALARYLTDGTLDDTFGAGGRVTFDLGGYDEARAVALQPDGRVVVAGVSQAFGPFPSGADVAVARLDADGRLDKTFGTGGVVTTDFGGYDEGLAVAVQDDGGIIVAGGTRADNGFDSTLILARYLGDPDACGG